MASMESDAVMVTHLFPPERASLVELLASLGVDQWQAPTACPGWSVKDVALHLLGDDIGLLSRRRDGVAPADAPSEPAGWRELVAVLDRLNQTWVEATRRISPRLLGELLEFTGEATWRYLASLDPFAVAARVSWVGPDPPRSRRHECCWTPRRPGGCGPRGSGRTRLWRPSRSRVIVRLAVGSWTPSPSSAERERRTPYPGRVPTTDA
jgi:mycothiol maleylpyruvate isomerase-like protein